MLVAGTELRHPPLKALTHSGKGSNKPEQYGADIAFTYKGKWYGIQRKEIRDFVASVNDKRLATDVQKMVAGLEQGIVVIEGDVRFSLDGEWLGGGYARWTRTQHIAQLLSIQDEGVWVLHSSSPADTAALCLDFERWVKKGSHTSLKGRAGVIVPWGKAQNRDYQRHVVMGLPGVGIELAARIVHEFDGLPFTWKPGALERLLEVEGIGEKTIAKFKAAIE